MDMDIVRGIPQSPALAKQNTQDCGRDYGMMGTVGGRDARKIDTVVAGGYAAEMYNNVVQIR